MDPLDQIDAELARCRGSLCDLADALTAPARPAPRALKRRGMLRAIAAIAAIALTAGAASAVLVFTAPARVLAHAGYHTTARTHARRGRRGFDFDHDGDAS